MVANWHIYKEYLPIVNFWLTALTKTGFADVRDTKDRYSLSIPIIWLSRSSEKDVAILLPTASLAALSGSSCKWA
jgi:hypothetical protein